MATAPLFFKQPEETPKHTYSPIPHNHVESANNTNQTTQTTPTTEIKQSFLEKHKTIIGYSAAIFNGLWGGR
jgi:hypothetical protein